MREANQIYLTPRGEPAVRLDELFEEGLKAEQSGLTPTAEGFEPSGPVTLALQLLPEGDGIALIGHFDWAGKLRCSRCGEPSEQRGRANFAYYLLPASQAPKEGDTHLDPGDMDLVYYDTPELNLAAVATEQLQLALPEKVLCTPACKGLCPRCGQNLNQAACDCPPEITDSRLAAFDKIASELFNKN